MKKQLKKLFLKFNFSIDDIMNNKIINDEWYDATYNECIKWLNDNNCMDELRKYNWIPQEEFCPLKGAREGLASMYPKRILSPILHRKDSDDIICATFIDEKINECPIVLIHDFASEGWEFWGQWNSITDWYEDKDAWQWL